MYILFCLRCTTTVVVTVFRTKFYVCSTVAGAAQNDCLFPKKITSESQRPKAQGTDSSISIIFALKM